MVKRFLLDECFQQDRTLQRKVFKGYSSVAVRRSKIMAIQLYGKNFFTGKPHRIRLLADMTWQFALENVQKNTILKQGQIKVMLPLRCHCGFPKNT